MYIFRKINHFYFFAHIKDMNREQQLTEYFKHKNNLYPLSINERSFQIFGDEKFLSSSEGKSLLNKYHISLLSLNVYNTPEPFIYYCKQDSKSDKALIIENKDTWYTMRKILQDTGKICGIEFKALIYGEGRKIQNSFNYIKEEDTRDIHDVKTFYYFGDIDSTGLDIFYKIRKNYNEYTILPFEPGYRYLLSQEGFKRVKSVKDNYLDAVKLLNLFPFFTNAENQRILDICKGNMILPQEILNYEKLKNW